MSLKIVAVNSLRSTYECHASCLLQLRFGNLEDCTVILKVNCISSKMVEWEIGILGGSTYTFLLLPFYSVVKFVYGERMEYIPFFSVSFDNSIALSYANPYS